MDNQEKKSSTADKKSNYHVTDLRRKAVGDHVCERKAGRSREGTVLRSNR